mgnify:CR=1 FL=1
MLRERKLLRKSIVFVNEKNEVTYEGGEDIVGRYIYPAYIDDLYVRIEDNKEKTKVNTEECFITEFESVESESDYHTFADEYHFNGVYMAFNLNKVDTLKYFGVDLKDELFNKDELIEGVNEILTSNGFRNVKDKNQIMIDERGYLQVVVLDKRFDDDIFSCSKEILNYIRNYYDKNGVHITRMFGSYILIKNENSDLKAIKATPIPIKYCPLMIKLLEEVGGENALSIIDTLKTEDKMKQEEAMLNLINNVVIKGGYFDTNRSLNSCEANVLFGASETMSSAFKSGLIDCSVIVSNNLGTIITTNEFNTQGAVKRMTGLFHTSPSEKIMETAYEEDIIPVFPYTAEIDQLEGVKMAIELGYKNIAVSVAASDNYLHEELSQLEKDNDVVIYKFGLCSTGIDYDTALAIKEHSDVVWSCASKYIKEEIEPNAVAQVGVKIPVHIMTEQGWKIVSNHLKYMGFLEDVTLQRGEEKPILLNNDGNIKVLTKKNLRKCTDCPHPCI